MGSPGGRMGAENGEGKAAHVREERGGASGLGVVALLRGILQVEDCVPVRAQSQKHSRGRHLLSTESIT